MRTNGELYRLSDYPEGTRWVALVHDQRTESTQYGPVVHNTTVDVVRVYTFDDAASRDAYASKWTRDRVRFRLLEVRELKVTTKVEVG